MRGEVCGRMAKGVNSDCTQRSMQYSATHPLLVGGKVIIPQRGVNVDNPIRCALRQYRVNPALSVLDVLFYKGDGEDFLALVAL